MSKGAEVVFSVGFSSLASTRISKGWQALLPICMYEKVGEYRRERLNWEWRTLSGGAKKRDKGRAKEKGKVRVRENGKEIRGQIGCMLKERGWDVLLYVTFAVTCFFVCVFITGRMYSDQLAV